MSTTTPHPVNSTYHPCCHAIGQHSRDCTTGNLSDPGANMPSMDSSTAADNRLSLIMEARRHIRAADEALQALRPYLDEHGEFVADITHAAGVGIGKLTVEQVYAR
ncbi:hypothetical protein KV112_02650 [Mycolicibacter sp. MYC123]|uniref:Uncharacterized protein n=1 Tax=[Mycobacterium] zoologicum TaxID=2872311 RepID=A0ABU5YF37_9MYCO|nr:hypothetical protein [Mycolicibacter sp. MYC123]MEB3048646.1 hypothetical protein [Mycolicibacter sp. MYC123]